MDHHESRSPAWLVASIVLAAAIVATLIAVVYAPPSSTKANTTSPATSSTTTSTPSSQSATSSSIQSQGGPNSGCITVVPYDALQPQFGGCGFYFSVLYNGCCISQSSPNGGQEINLGWTLIVGARQSTGPSENATFGWDPAGPSIASGERLPTPSNLTLFNGTLAIQWRIYNSTSPRLYAWMAASFPGDEQFIANESTFALCPTAPWPSQVSTFYQPAVRQVEQNPVVTALKGGLCYPYAGNSYGTSPAGNTTVFYFDEYNGMIYYPCGTFPAKLVVSQVWAGVNYNGNETDGVIIFAGQENDLRNLNTWSCPAGLLPVQLISVSLVPPFTPAGPTIEVTLSSPAGQMPITNLTAVISLPGKDQIFKFSDVSASSPLLPGNSASQTEIVVGPASVDTDATYPMTIEGSFQGGQAFSLPVTIQIQASNASGVSPG